MLNPDQSVEEHLGQNPIEGSVVEKILIGKEIVEQEYREESRDL